MTVFREPMENWYRELFANHLPACQVKVDELLAGATTDENGCMVTQTTGPRKVRFKGPQTRAYRFVYCVTRRYPAAWSEVVRHRCNNRRCVNPQHLELGSRYDNRQDDRRFRAEGVDFAALR